MVILYYTNLNKPKKLIMENQTNLFTLNSLKGNQKMVDSIAKNFTPFKEPKDYSTFVNYIGGMNFLKEKGLKLILNQGNLSRGTIAVVDPLTKRKFAITINGYIRTYKYYKYYGIRTYQLNPQNIHSPIGYNSSRILFPGEYSYMAQLLWKSIKNIRKNK
jgi:hypothetical protein